MDSMDWFDPNVENAREDGSVDPATQQIRALHRALRLKGIVLLRSAGLMPWYISVFKTCGFDVERVGARLPGTCIDR